MKNDDFTIETRIIEPCLEFLEKIERKRDRYRDIDLNMRQKRIELKKYIRGGTVLPRVVVIVGTKCTLCCKDCADLMPCYSEPYDIPIDELLRDLRQLFSLVDYCMCVEIIGGEPFLYPYMDVLLDYLINNSHVASIELTTNATVIPNIQVLEKLSDIKITVIISDYGEIVKMSSLIKAMDEYGIRMHIEVNMKWVDMGDCRSRERQHTFLEEIYASCRPGKMCKTLLKGKLFPCSRAARLVDLGYADNIEFLDIYNCTKNDIYSFCLKRYTMACDYCDLSIKDKKYIEPAVQINGKRFRRSSCSLIPRDDYEEIWNANDWFKQQLKNYKKRVVELEEWIKDLSAGKDWLEEQYIRQKEIIAKLENQGE